MAEDLNIPLILNATGQKISLYDEGTEEYIKTYHENVDVVVFVREYDKYYIEPKSGIPIYTDYKTTISSLPTQYDSKKCMLCVNADIADYIKTHNLWSGIILTIGKIKYNHEYDIGIYGFALVSLTL